MFKKAFRTINYGIAAALYGASLASPVIGAVAGGIMHGLLGAVIGLFAGPVVAVTSGLIYSYALSGMNKLLGNPMQFPPQAKAPIKQRVQEFGKGMMRMLCWGVNLSVYVVTFGAVNLNLDSALNKQRKPPSPPPTPPASSADNSLTGLNLQKPFSKHSTAAKDNPTSDSPAKPQEPKI